MEQSRSRADDALREAAALRAEAGQLATQARNQKEKLDEQKKQLIREARHEARELYADALRAVDCLMDEIRAKMKAENLSERQKEAAQLRQEIRAGLKTVDSAISQSALATGGRNLRADEIVVGRHYAAPSLGITGKLLEGPDARGACLLQTGSMKVSVPQDALRHLQNEAGHAAPETGQKGTGRRKQNRKRTDDQLTMERHMNMPTEIQLLGQTVEEATANLDKFIDDAVLGGIQSIRIVHGKGTGALRSAVQQMLRRDSRVKNWRLGTYGEGDSGVTFAELK